MLEHFTWMNGKYAVSANPLHSVIRAFYSQFLFIGE